jgi:hypothetical protein
MRQVSRNHLALPGTYIICPVRKAGGSLGPHFWLYLLADLARPDEEVKLALQDDLLLSVACKLGPPPLRYDVLVYCGKGGFFSHPWQFCLDSRRIQYLLRA